MQDMTKLRNEFVMSYKECHCFLYVFLFHEESWEKLVFLDDEAWANGLVNDWFEELLQADPDFHHDNTMYFSVYERNCCVTALMWYIEQYKKLHVLWYITINYIVLEAHEKSNVVNKAMEDINW